MFAQNNDKIFSKFYANSISKIAFDESRKKIDA